MSKDRLTDLQKASPWPTVSYGKLSLQLPNDDDQSITVPTDKESRITQFLNEMESLRLIIDRIDELTQQVKQVHSAMLQPTASPKLAQQLDEKMEEVQKLSCQTSAKLKKLEQAKTYHDDDEDTNAQWRIRESQIFVMTRRFRDTMLEYNKETMRHREKCTKVIARELEISGNHRTYDELDEMLDSGFPGTFSFSIMVHTQSAQRSLDEIEARHRDITRLEKSIKELHDMFLDLAILVADQGEMVDSIEHNVSKAVDFVDDATENVYTTNQYHMKAVQKKVVVMILSVIVILIVLFVLIMYLARRKPARG